MSRVPLAVLDLSPISEGSTARRALKNTIDLAQHTERWGYTRYWVAEHHFVAVASSSPAVLIGLIATIDALFPGRIDLGLGRSGQRRAEAVTGKNEPAPPREPTIVEGILFPAPFRLTPLILSERFAAAATALQQPGAEVPDFNDQLDDVIALIGGTFETHGGVHLSATPGEGAEVELWLFGSSGGQSAQIAGARGLPFVANYHVSPGTTLDAIEAYRAAFAPSSVLDEPYIVVSADALVAETDSQAEHLASPFPHWVHSIRSGHGAIPYPNPDAVDALTPEQAASVDDRIATRFVGPAATVAEKLDGLQRATGAKELLVTTITYDHEDRLRSYELLAKEWGLPLLDGLSTG